MGVALVEGRSNWLPCIMAPRRMQEGAAGDGCATSRQRLMIAAFMRWGLLLAPPVDDPGATSLRCPGRGAHQGAEIAIGRDRPFEIDPQFGNDSAPVIVVAVGEDAVARTAPEGVVEGTPDL